MSILRALDIFKLRSSAFLSSFGTSSGTAVLLGAIINVNVCYFFTDVPAPKLKGFAPKIEPLLGASSFFSLPSSFLDLSSAFSFNFASSSFFFYFWPYPIGAWAEIEAPSKLPPKETCFSPLDI